MEGAQFLLEAVLVLLLAATLFHALRLERALGVLKRDRAVLEELVAGFNESTRAAEAGIDRLRGATDGAGRQIARQIELAQRLRDDLGFLTDRGERLAERLEQGVRSARMYADQQSIGPGKPGMQAGGRHGVAAPAPVASFGTMSGMMPGVAQVPAQIAPMQMPVAEEPPSATYAPPEPASGPRLRSEAERDLLRALRAAR
jgi:hypothetical protein